jgi:hypothetical protein
VLPETTALYAMRLFRTLLDDMAAADEARRSDLLIVARYALETFCEDCGALIETPLRHRNPPELYCLECLTPPGSLLSRPIQPQDDAFPLRRTPPAQPDDGIPF